MFKKTLFVLFLIAMTALMNSTSLAQFPPISGGMLDVIQQAHEQQRKALIGSWFLTVNSPLNQFNPSYSLLSINEGGTAISVQQGDVSANLNPVWGVPVIQSSKLGSWVHKSGREFAYSQFSLNYFSLVRDAEPKMYLGMTKVWLNVTLDESGNSFTATVSKAERVNFAGQVVPLSTDLTISGTRISAEPQP